MAGDGKGLWAATSRCPRWAFYAATGAPAEPPTELDRRRWRRGVDCERYVLETLEAIHGAGNVRRDVTLEWPGGLAHPDAVVTGAVNNGEMDLTVEVKSRLDLYTPIPDHELIQLAGYIEFAPGPSDCGALIIIEPVDYTTRSVAVIVRPGLREVVHARIDALMGGLESQEPPERVCSSPTDTLARYCPHAAHCFEGWEAPRPIVLDDSGMVRLARELLEADITYAASRKQEELDKSRRDRIRAELAPALEPGQTYQLAGVTLKRSVTRKTSYRAAEAIRCGAIDAAALEPFKTEAEYEGNWTIRGTLEGPGPGEEEDEIPY